MATPQGKSPNGKQALPGGEVRPEEIARIQASIAGLEQAPSTLQQVGASVNWRQVQDQLGDPFNNERIPLSRLKLMRRDAMLAFGMHFQKVPMVRAPYFMKCPNPQIAGFMDGALRPIMPSLIVQALQIYDFGFQAMAKRFQQAAPQGTYIDEASGEELPVWDTTGGVQPITLKPFVPLPPEGVNPLWSNLGEFDGIEYKPPTGGAPSGVQTRKKSAGGSSGAVEIDVYHALWATNEKESVFGNIFGYPRLGYAFPYWWSYWFRWAIADRAFERKGDPATIVRHPSGDIDLGNGETMPAQEYALLMADRLRAGAGIALPSQPYTNFEDRPSQVREWDVEFLKGGIELDPFDKSFNYLDVQKLRSIFVPEQALIEGGGGTSSRNVAAEMYEGLVEAQSLTMSMIVDMVNRFIIPHLMVVNFPQEFNQGIRCEMKTRGFASQDMEMLLQIVQLIGQQDAELLGVNVREALRQLNMPMLTQKQFDDRLAQKAAEAAAAGPGAVPPGPDQSGVVPTPGRAPATAANTPGPNGNGNGSFTGFTYVPSLDRIELANTLSADFLANLPATMHYEDKTIRSLTRGLWTMAREFYKSQYDGYAEYLDSLEEPLKLAIENDEEEGVELAVPDIIREIGRRTVANWTVPVSQLDDFVHRASDLIQKISTRAAEVTRKKTGIAASIPADEIKAWVENHVTDVISSAIASTREELIDFTASTFEEGVEDPQEIAKRVRSHYTEFPIWKASRFAKTEARDSFNAGLLLVGQAEGFAAAQAIDGQLGNTDADCEFRDGRIYTLDAALREREHPNGTLGWRLLREPVELARVDELPESEDQIPGSVGFYDPEAKRIYIQKDVDPEDERTLLMAVGDELSA